VAVLAIGLVFRCIAAFLAVFGLGLKLKEKLFIPIAWLPKATVQVISYTFNFIIRKLSPSIL
jgi:hypothetical protein